MLRRRHPTRFGDRGPLVVAVVAVAGLVGYPLVRLAQSAGGQAIVHAWHTPGLATVAWHTVALAGVVTAVAVPMGAGLALLLAAPGLPLRRTLVAGVLLPLVTPQFVLGYSWGQAYGRAGFSDSVAGVHWSGLYGPAGVATVLVVDATPIVYLLVTAGLATRAQPDTERAARMSGASAWTALSTVTLPLLRPVLAAAGVITFVGTLESFAVPQVLGTPAGFATITTRIYADVALGGDPATFDQALALSLGLVVLATVILLPADVVLTPRLRSVRTPQSAAVRVMRHRGAGPWVAVAGVVGYLLFAVGLPSIALLAAAVTPAIGVSPTPGNWTLANLRGLLTSTTGTELAHSVELAAAAACILTLLGTLVAMLGQRRSGRVLGAVATLTLVVPGSALAVAVLIAYGRYLAGTLTLILLAYLAKMWALALRPISGALDRLPDAERQAARASGAGPPTAVRTVVLPALAPALAGGWLLVFVTALHEVTMSSLLYSTGSQTLAVAVLNSEGLGDIGPTAALALLLTLLVVVAAGAAWGLFRLATTASSRRTGAAVPEPLLEVAGAR